VQITTKAVIRNDYLTRMMNLSVKVNYRKTSNKHRGRLLEHGHQNSGVYVGDVY